MMKEKLYTNNLEKMMKEKFNESLSPEFLNMLRLGSLAYENGYNKFANEKKLIEWVQFCYKAGKEQREINEIKKEIYPELNKSYISSIASYLKELGKKERYLSKRKR